MKRNRGGIGAVLGFAVSLVSLYAFPAFAKNPLAKTSGASGKGTAAAQSKVIHWGGDRSTVSRKTHLVQLRGKAYLLRDYEDFRADEIDYNTETQEVYARGRVRYQYIDAFVKADSIYVDIRNKTGSIINGNLTNGQFALRGAKMEQVGENHYHVTDYDYTTCVDCPNSWEMTGKNADITIEGYAFIKNFIFKVRDVSFFWLPYMVVPIKTKRQSGLLFPRFGINDVHGFHYVQPYFWAVNDWSDMTLGFGDYSKRGARFEWEGRYALTDRSNGIINYFWTRDSEVGELWYRYAATARLTQELPGGFEGKLRVNEVSDSGYPIIYSEDVPGRFEPVLSSDLFFSKNDPDVSTAVSFRRIRNLLYFNPANKPNEYTSGFDPGTVQEFPRVVVNSNDQFLFGGKLAAGIEGRFNRFSRNAAPFDNISSDTTVQNCPPTDKNCVIREANRVTLIPGVYTTLNPWPWLSVVPSVQYRSYFYNFSGNYNNLARGYLLAQVDTSLQLERSIPTTNEKVSYRHTIRPGLTYSTIPTSTILESSDHPFVARIAEQARPGQYFDDSDIVPLSTSQNLESYFPPLGNSLTYSLTSQLYRREKSDQGEVKVDKRAEVTAQQTLDIREANRYLRSGQTERRVILSPFYLSTMYAQNNFTFSSEYTYYSYLNNYPADTLKQLVNNPNPHRLSSTLTWTLEKAQHQGILWYERSIGLNYTYSRLTSKTSSLRADLIYSINDYIMPQVSYSLDLISIPNQVLDSRYAVIFQSPSRCWRADFGVTNSKDRGVGFDFNIALNLTGSSFASKNR